MDYKSAKIVAASGNLTKNKGVMLIGVAGNACQLRFKGLSGGNYTDYSAGLTLATGQSVVIVPVSVYGATLGSGQLFELN